ncbi:MAG TPA: bifunctional [glutamate--ammonia ligase]-adenylyl-L-tyrosine phosphorylase/[glutamate--ammonia-ligase] adenylyltransferase [Steroidobacteraceae bacterium]|jgi:glutamate-ammonia-ligase adenylyltransferase|nr:bifunctional [glutamate--ammonia ligase]-adenylyl-L-tyrosine phosphorylase/[glutamate--ammonia-ligase] adenylyltransferase [Steroidobacteraceae bacterium]
MTASMEFTGSVPQALRESVERWWERACALDGFADRYQALSEDHRRQLPQVIAASEFASQVLLQDPPSLQWFVRFDASESSVANGGYAPLAAAAPSVEETQRILREWRRRAMLRIAWRDIAGSAAVAETLLALSDLADACIRAAASAAELHLQPIFGRPFSSNPSRESFVILGMGKLGGRELNFSSDIDLVFLFTEPGETSGPRVLDNEEYFNRLGREIIRLLDVRNADGFVFRVDMRLRPFGDSGPLVVSLASLEDYLQQHGRDWERYAWIKARAIVGAGSYASAYEEFVRPFVYRRYLDFGVFESLRGMKALIVREVARRDLDHHLKLGRGGIREIEFIVQSMQLVRGGSDRRLQKTALLEVLPLLTGSKLVSRDDVAELTEAYFLLRKAENALQMVRDQQTHTLPEDPADRARLALSMGFDDWDATSQAIESTFDAVAGQFDALLFGAPQQRRNDDPGVAWLDAANTKIDEELANGGFPGGEIPAVAAALESYRQAASYRRLDEAGHRRLYVILARLLKSAAERASPAIVVQRVLRVLEAIGMRASYLALLKEQPAALDRLIDVCAVSGFLSAQIAAFPLLLDELIDAKAFAELPTRQGFTRELAARTERLSPEDPERQVEALRQFQKVAVFSVALADLTGRLPLMRVSDRLTDIAELIVQCCMDLAWQQMTHAYGTPYCGEEAGSLRPVAVAVAGYGKLGGLELGYSSDLDLVFLHDSAGSIQLTDGERPLDNGIFFLRLGQRIVHLLTMHSAAGRLYEVDMRLRPNGKGGFLMTGIDAFERYQRSDAWTWEHQALLRARAVGGSAALCAAFEAVRLRVLSSAVRRERLRADVLEMRLRMRKELSRSEAGQFDIKQDEGGISDLEFLVQYWVLASAEEHPQLLTYSDNIRQLEGLAAAGVIDEAASQWLKQAYIGYRTVLHHLSLEGDGERIVAAGPYRGIRDRLAEIWRATFETAP